MMRGINKQSIFGDKEDYERFIKTIQKYKEKSRYKVYAYSLMGNHVHLLIKVDKEPLGQIMRRICGSYVYWYNKKYNRIGNLFQDRFKSEPIDDDEYFLTVLRYIHQNPIKAGLEKTIGNYRWNSYNEYLGECIIVDSNFVLSMFSDDKKEALNSFIHYNNEVNDDKCLEVEERRRITDEEATVIIKKVCKIKHAMDLQKFNKLQRDIYLRKLKKEYNLSIRQIERITGINRGVVQKF